MVASISAENLSSVKIAIPLSQHKVRSKKTFIPITFGISEAPGKDVKIAGSFNNWQPEDTHFNPFTSHYEFIYSFDLDLLDLAGSEEKYSIQYKYVVDGEWKINEKVESTTDSVGNVNNLLCISAVADEVTWDESVVDPFTSIPEEKHRFKTLVGWIKKALGLKRKGK